MSDSSAVRLLVVAVATLSLLNVCLTMLMLGQFILATVFLSAASLFLLLWAVVLMTSAAVLVILVLRGYGIGHPNVRMTLGASLLTTISGQLVGMTMFRFSLFLVLGLLSLLAHGCLLALGLAGPRAGHALRVKDPYDKAIGHAQAAFVFVPIWLVFTAGVAMAFSMWSMNWFEVLLTPSDRSYQDPLVVASARFAWAAALLVPVVGAFVITPRRRPPCWLARTFVYSGFVCSTVVVLDAFYHAGLFGFLAAGALLVYLAAARQLSAAEPWSWHPAPTNA